VLQEACQITTILSQVNDNQGASTQLTFSSLQSAIKLKVLMVYFNPFNAGRNLPMKLKALV
jgi:hypothetical protein